LIGEDVTTALLDWRVLAGLAVIAAVSALVSLYLSAFLLGLSGWMFRGHASPAAMRAVVAWSMAPFCAALVISLALIAASVSLVAATPRGRPLPRSRVHGTSPTWLPPHGRSLAY